MYAIVTVSITSSVGIIPDLYTEPCIVTVSHSMGLSGSIQISFKIRSTELICPNKSTDLVKAVRWHKTK